MAKYKPARVSRQKSEDFETEQVFCVNCGEALDDQIGVLASPDWYENTRFSHYCRTCQQKRFEDLAEQTSPSFAYFLCCAAFDLPFIPEAIPVNGYEIDELTWLVYLENLENTEYRLRVDGEPAGFNDGMTDLSVLFGGKINATTKFAPGASMELTARKVPGTKAQRRKWGEREDYEDSDYKELDRLYSVRAEGFLESGIDSEMEFNLRKICKLDLAYTKAMEKGDIDNAKKLYDVQSKMMADNLLRKKDEAPVEKMKLDNLTDALEKAGFIKSGDILPHDELLEKLRNDHARYPMSHDMLDYILLAMVNCTRRNAGQPETDKLPYEFLFIEQFGELERGLTEREQRIVKQLGLSEMQYEIPPDLMQPKKKRK